MSSNFESLKNEMKEILTKIKVESEATGSVSSETRGQFDRLGQIVDQLIAMDQYDEAMDQINQEWGVKA